MELNNLVRENILKLKPYESARSSHLNGILLDANENSMGSVVDFPGMKDLNRYPDPNQNELREKLGTVLSINTENIFFGVGSDEIIDLLIRIFCEPGKDEVIIAEPTYGMYKTACDINNVNTITVPLDNNFQPNAAHILNSANDKTKIVFLCSPNNPTGNLLDKAKVLEIAHRFNGIIIVDEAYADFSEEDSFINNIQKYNNIVVLRTFSKAWGLAGIRCGYCIADEGIIKLLFKVKAPYNFNRLSAYVIKEALNNVEKRNRFINSITYERERLEKELLLIPGVEKVFPSQANFILFKMKSAKNIFSKLADRGIIIRDRSTQVNLNDCLRLSIGTKEENNIFLKTLREIT